MPDFDAGFGAIRRQVEAGANERCRNIAQRLRQRLFSQQVDFVDDPERHKSLLCPRRAGKSYALAVYILITALMRPNANIVFVARTRDKAKEILWELLKQLNKEFEIGIDFSEVHTSGRTPNNSRFRLRGCETLADVEQYRGEPFHLAVIDECGTFSSGVLKHLIERGIEPTLGDYLGTLVLSGTPGAVLAGPFYESTGPSAFTVEDNQVAARPYAARNSLQWANVDYGWSFHRWSRKENIILPHLWEEALRIKRLNKWTDQNPVWRREYLGEWIADDSNLVYKFNPESNLWLPDRFPGHEVVRGDNWIRSHGAKPGLNFFGLPDDGKWHYVAGMDFGSKDPFALSVLAYSENRPELLQVYEYVKAGLLPKDMAQVIKSVQEIAEIEWMIGDFGPFGDMLQAQMLQEHGLKIEKAIKKDKVDHIQLLNGDLTDGRCFLLPDSEVARQMGILSWDDTGLKEKVGGNVRNDACDAVVYTWRRTFHHLHEVPKEPIEPGTPEFEQAREEAEVAEAIRRDIAERDPTVVVDDPDGAAAEYEEWSWL